MGVNKALDDLIEAGWQVIGSNFNPDAYAQWRKRALDCMTILIESDYPYAQYLDESISREAENSLLTGVRILEAAKEQLTVQGPTSNHGDLESLNRANRHGGNA